MEDTVKKIHNLIILDESGSMGMVKDSVIRGFKDLSREIMMSEVEFKSQKHFASLATFKGNEISFKLFNQPANELIQISDDNYSPDSTTPLYDAICKSVLKLKHELYHEENYVVLVTVITDGIENSSEEFSLKETRFLIESISEDERWGFGLIGANIDVEDTASSLSIPLKRTLRFESEDKSVSSMFSRYGRSQRNMANVLNDGSGFDDIPF